MKPSKVKYLFHKFNTDLVDCAWNRRLNLDDCLAALSRKLLNFAAIWPQFANSDRPIIVIFYRNRLVFNRLRMRANCGPTSSAINNHPRYPRRKSVGNFEFLPALKRPRRVYPGGAKTGQLRGLETSFSSRHPVGWVANGIRLSRKRSIIDNWQLIISNWQFNFWILTPWLKTRNE